MTFGQKEKKRLSIRISTGTVVSTLILVAGRIEQNIFPTVKECISLQR